MHVKIIEGESTDRIRRACYAYLVEKYRRERKDGRDLRSGIDGRVRQEGIQHQRSTPGMPEEGRDGRGDRVHRRGDLRGVPGPPGPDKAPGGREARTDHEGGVSGSGPTEPETDEPTDRD